MPTLRDAFDAFVYIVRTLGWGWGMSFIFLATTILFAALWLRKRRNRDVQFFRDRSALPGTLAEELKTSGDTFWVIWQAGHQVPVLESHVRGKIKRMILGNPNAPEEVLQQWAEESDASTAEAVKSRIREAAWSAKSSGVEVKWTNEKRLSFIIANPTHTDDSGSIRIEYVVPHLTATARPSLKVTKKDYPQLFNAFVRAYEDMWSKSLSSDS